MHLLSGEVSAESFVESADRGAADIAVSPSELEKLRAEQKELTAKVERLQALVEHMAGQLGIAVDDFPV
jgi:cell division protein FtsB